MPRKATRNAQGGGSIRKRANGSWEGRYTVGRDPGTGKQIQKSVYGKTQTEVRKKIQAACAAIDDGIYMEPSKLTVDRWLNIWLNEYAKKEIKPLTATTYETQIRTHIVPSLGAVKLSTLNTHEIQSFYNRLEAGTAEKPGLSSKTIKNIHGVFHRALNKATELRYIPFNPADACSLPRIEKKEIKPLEEAEITAFLRALEGERYKNVFLVTLFTGMRESEVLGLSWPLVDFQRGTITISKQLQKERNGKYYLSSPKNGKSRTISPAPFVMDTLAQEQRKQVENRLAAERAWDNPLNLVFTDELGKNLVHRTVVKHFKALASELGIPEARFHDLRHTYAVLSISAGDDVKTVQENLGHHTAAFTLDVYGHVSECMRQESAQRMEMTIKGFQERKG